MHNNTGTTNPLREREPCKELVCTADLWENLTSSQRPNNEVLKKDVRGGVGVVPRRRGCLKGITGINNHLTFANQYCQMCRGVQTYCQVVDKSPSRRWVNSLSQTFSHFGLTFWLLV